MADLIKACECSSLEEVRNQIDHIDQDIIRLFAKRYEYVKEVVKFKEKSEDAIVAKERKDQVILQRSEWAEDYGLDKKAYATIFTTLVEHNISKEMEILEKEEKV